MSRKRKFAQILNEDQKSDDFSSTSEKMISKRDPKEWKYGSQVMIKRSFMNKADKKISL